MLPDGWKNQSLQSVAPVIDCKHRTPTYVVTGVPIVSPGNISWGPLRLDGCRQVSEDDYSELMNHCSVKVGDLVFGRNQSVGVSSVVVDDSPFALGQDTVLIQPEKVDPAFLNQWLRSPLFEKDIRRLLGGSTFGRINLKDLRHLPMPIPPALEARKIAEILFTWDRAIETVDALIANARAQKKALMQSLLTGKHRLPGFSGAWKSVELKSMGKTSSGGTPDSDNDDYWNGDILWTTPTDITALNHKYITDTKRKISATGLANCSAKLLPAGTLLICTRATIGDMAIATSPISTNQGFKNLTPNASFVSEFLFHLFGFHKHIFIRYACGSTFLELSKFDFEKREFLVPGRAEQQAIADILDDADLVIESFEAEAQTLRQEKSALMQQLLTGERRVKVSEKEAAHA